MGGSNGGPERAAREDGSKMAGLAARKVDQVRLAESLERRGVGTLIDIADENALDFGTEGSEVRAAQLRPATKDGKIILVSE